MLPSFDDDDQIPTRGMRYRNDSVNSSSVCVALNELFEAAAIISDDDCSKNTSAESLFERCSRNRPCE